MKSEEELDEHFYTGAHPQAEPDAAPGAPSAPGQRLADRREHLMADKRFRITYKDKAGELMYVNLLAKDKEEAERLAERYQFRRHERFPLTFARLEEAAATGNPGLLALDPRLTGKALTEAFVKAETEKRRRDQVRYDDGTLKVVKVEEKD